MADVTLHTILYWKVHPPSMPVIHPHRDSYSFLFLPNPHVAPRAPVSECNYICMPKQL